MKPNQPLTHHYQKKDQMTPYSFVVLQTSRNHLEEFKKTYCKQNQQGWFGGSELKYQAYHNSDCFINIPVLDLETGVVTRLSIPRTDSG